MAGSGFASNDPRRIMNSPMNPLVPGSPIELKVTMISTTAYQGMIFAIPPKSSSRRVWRRS